MTEREDPKKDKPLYKSIKKEIPCCRLIVGSKDSEDSSSSSRQKETTTKRNLQIDKVQHTSQKPNHKGQSDGLCRDVTVELPLVSSTTTPAGVTLTLRRLLPPGGERGFPWSVDPVGEPSRGCRKM